MRKIERIFVHCSGGWQTESVREVLLGFKARGWKKPGYHYFITFDGKINQLLDEGEVSNGVQGYNQTAINVCYAGGIKNVGGKMVAVDNRTEAQKKSLRQLLKLLRKKYPGAKIKGHRSIWGEDTPQKWKKTCPNFNAVEEYKDI